MSKKIMIISFLIFLLFIQVSSAIQISEIMYEPAFTEEYNEWIELYNDADNSINLENLTLCGKKISLGYLNHEDNKTYQNMTNILESKGYAVITDGGTGTEAYQNYNIEGIAFHTETPTICGGLSNMGKEIILSESGLVFDNITYPQIAGLGNSISRNSIVNSTANSSTASLFSDSIPTPGYDNQLVAVLSENNPTDETSSQSQDTIGTSECDWRMEIVIEKEIFEEEDKFTFKTKATKISGSKTNMSGEARLINTKGDVIKRYALFDNYEATYSKTITINNQDVSGEMRLEAELKTSCDDIDIDNNIATLYVYVKKNEAVSTKEREQRRTPLFESESRLEIDGSDDKADLFFYRGNISKYAVYITLNSDGEKTKQTIHLKDKFSEYSMTLPFPKCSSENIIDLDGLGLHEEKTFIKVNPCEVLAENQTNKNIINPESTLVNSSDSSHTSSQNNLITGNSVLQVQSSNQNNQKSFLQDFDAKRTSLIVLLALSIMMNVLFIWFR